MYEGNKLHRVTLRLNLDQFNYVKSNADILGVSPSEFLRMVINSSMALSTKVEGAFEKTVKGGLGRENDKADRNDLV